MTEEMIVRARGQSFKTGHIPTPDNGWFCLNSMAIMLDQSYIAAVKVHSLFSSQLSYILCQLAYLWFS